MGRGTSRDALTSMTTGLARSAMSYYLRRAENAVRKSIGACISHEPLHTLILLSPLIVGLVGGDLVVDHRH